MKTTTQAEFVRASQAAVNRILDRLGIRPRVWGTGFTARIARKAYGLALWLSGAFAGAADALKSRFSREVSQ